jgi:hypothetical protein
MNDDFKNFLRGQKIIYRALEDAFKKESKDETEDEAAFYLEEFEDDTRDEHQAQADDLAIDAIKEGEKTYF